MLTSFHYAILYEFALVIALYKGKNKGRNAETEFIIMSNRHVEKIFLLCYNVFAAGIGKLYNVEQEI